MNRVAIIGVGLIGGSFALALRKAGFQGDIVGVSSPEAIEVGVRAGAISRGVSLEEAARQADCIYLAQPVDRILRTLIELGPIVRPGCLVTDAGSTKAAIVQQASRFLGEGMFLGGHPLAGKEQRGAAAADPDLFRSRPYVLIPRNVVSPNEASFRGWLDRMGAQVIEMTPDEHDAAVAFSSHLPQLLSTALAATLAGQPTLRTKEVYGPGLVDMTRLALSSPDLWTSILKTNQDHVSTAIDELIASLLELKGALSNPSVLVRTFTTACNYSSNLRNSA